MTLFGKPEFDKTIGCMQEGESGYALPWALMFDDNKIPYLSLEMPIYEDKRKRGEADLGERILIKKTGPGQEDYDVDIRDCNFRWYTDSDLEEQVRNGYQEVVCLDKEKARQIDEEIEQEQNAIQTKQYASTGGVIQGDAWKDHEKPEKTNLLHYCDDPNIFPKTHEYRKDLNAMIDAELYEDAAQMRDLINETDEPLNGEVSLDLRIQDIADDVAIKIVVRKKPCLADPQQYPKTHEYRQKLNNLKAEGHYDRALAIAVLINTTDEPLEL